MITISFKSINIDGQECSWGYRNRQEIKNEWLSDSIDMNVPANDDEIFDVYVDGMKIFSSPGIKYCFEDLIKHLGIEN